jgi:membrane protein YqaA with SNARE-associated domain
MRFTHVLIFFLLLGVIIMLFLDQVIGLILWFAGVIGTNFPFTKPAIDFSIEHILAGDLIGLFLVMYFGRNPLLPLPLEPYLLFSYATTGSLIGVWLVSSIAITLAVCTTYLVGYVLGRRFVEFIFRDKIEKNKWFEKYTGVFAFAVMILPFPEIMSIIFGVHRSNFKHFLIGTLAGILFRYLLTLLLYSYFEAQVVSFFEPYFATFPFLKSFF